VIHVRVGYAGGTGTSPTYYNLGGHAETVQIDYDPEKVSYDELLQVFWDSHDPPTMPLPSQYRSVVFYHDDQQRGLALGGYGTLKALEQQLPFFGLSPETSSRLLEIGSRILPVVDEPTGTNCLVKG